MSKYRSLEDQFRDIYNERRKPATVEPAPVQEVANEEAPEPVVSESTFEELEADLVEQLEEELNETLIDVAIHLLDTEGWSQLDELSKSTLGSYIKSAARDVQSKSVTADHRLRAKEDSAYEAAFKKAHKRRMGINKAVSKLTKEEFDELNEISKDTLVDYIGHATIDKGKHDKKADAAIVAQDYHKFNKHFEKSNKRAKGIGMAAKKLQKEEAEPIDELTKDTLKSYADKAHLSSQKHISARRKAADAGDRKGFDHHDRKYVNRRDGASKAYHRVYNNIRVTKEETDPMAELKEQALQALMERRGRPPKDPEKLKAYHAAKAAGDGDGDSDDHARASIQHLSKGADHPAGGHLTIGGVKKHYPRSMHKAALNKLRSSHMKPHEKQALEKDMFSSHERFVHHAKG